MIKISEGLYVDKVRSVTFRYVSSTRYYIEVYGTYAFSEWSREDAIAAVKKLAEEQNESSL